MANRFVKHIVVLLAGLCCMATVHAQTDTTATYSDTTVVDTSGSGDSDNSSETIAGLAKFNQKQPLQQVGERKVNNPAIEELKKENSWWYNKEEPQKNNSSSNGKSFWRFINLDVMKFVFWAIIISAFILIIVLYLRTFTGSSRKIRSAGASIADVQEDIFTTNFDDQINKALAEYNYRLATRLLFLRVLRTMAEKGIINYGQDKTNMDYLFELGNTRYARDFMQASRNYEYVWYGNFIPAQGQFAQIRQQLDDLKPKDN